MPEGLPDPDRARTSTPPVDALLALATRAVDDGDYARVVALFRAAIAAGVVPAAAARWRQLLIEAGDFKAAEAARSLAGLPPAAPEDDVAVSDALPPRDGDPSSAASDAADDFLSFDPGPRVDVPPGVDRALVDAFLRWFAGRNDVYARQWYDARRDRSGYWPVRAALTPALVQDHLLGRVTVGQYLLHPDNTVAWAVIDLDPTAEALEAVRLADGGEGALAARPLVDYAARLVDVATRTGLAPVAEDTGGAGLHVWLFFSPRLPAERARALARELLFRAGPQPPAVSVEIFPKQDRLTGKGLGNLVKLPLGVHQATLRRSRFLDALLAPLDDATGLSRLRACDVVAVDALLAGRVVTLPTAWTGTPAPTPEPPLPSRPTGPTPRHLAEALAAVPPGRPSAGAADRILAGCGVLRELARQAHEDRALPPDAARALVYTVGLVGRENERIEAMLANAGVGRKELDRVRRGLQSPTGCKKLRERFPDLCGGCMCPEPADGGYATPALFALHAPPPASRSAPPWIEAADIVEAPPAASVAALEERLARIEAALARLLGGGSGGEVE